VQMLKQDGAILPLRDGRYKLNPARLIWRRAVNLYISQWGFIINEVWRVWQRCRGWKTKSDLL
jgi:hypothetical protein